MTGKTHAGIGAAVGMAVCDKIPGGFNLVGMCVLLVAAVLPDIDHPKGILNSYILPVKNKSIKMLVYGSLGVLILFGNYYKFHILILYILGAMLVVIAVSSHRTGLLHSACGMIIFTILTAYAADMYKVHNMVYYFMLGYGLHLLCDMSTSRGVPILYPFTSKNYKFSYTYRVGSSRGKIIEKILIIICLIYIVYRMPVVLQSLGGLYV